LVNKSSIPILYANDTSILCSNSNSTELVTTLKEILIKINEWFLHNSLTLNLSKTNCVYFATKSNLLKKLKYSIIFFLVGWDLTPIRSLCRSLGPYKPQYCGHILAYCTSKYSIIHRDTVIHNTCNVKFLGLIIDNSLSWKDHINQLAIKPTSAVFVIRTLSSVVSQESLLMTYYAYVHSIMTYGIIFLSNSANSNLIFKIQKRTVRIIMKARKTDSSRPLFVYIFNSHVCC
jgi:hypothetical protein